MRLAMKLAALAIILLAAKSHVYLSKAYLSDAQAAPERAMSVPAAHGNVNPTSHLTISAASKQGNNAACAQTPGHYPSDTAALHAMDEIPKGS